MIMFKMQLISLVITRLKYTVQLGWLEFPIRAAALWALWPSAPLDEALARLSLLRP